MLVFMKLGWRNLFRNKRRTIITAIVIAMGLATLSFADAFVKGMLKNMAQTITTTFMGDGQIHNDKYRDSDDPLLTIVKGDSLLNMLKKDNRITAITERLYIQGMITSSQNMSPAVFVGVNPEEEGSFSVIKKRIINGNFLSEEKENDIIVGAKLADLLEIKKGDRLIVTVFNNKTEEISQEMFRVGGIYKTGTNEMDGMMIFLCLSKLQEMSGIDGVHEIAFKLNDYSLAMDKMNSFWQQYSLFGNVCIPWVKLFDGFEYMMDSTKISRIIMIIILFGIVALAIVNTLFMAIYERFFEFGVLRAIGTMKKQIAWMIIFESAGLAIVSIILGLLVHLSIMIILVHVGIDAYRGIDFMGMTLVEKIYPLFTRRQFVDYPILLFIVTILVSLYPAIYAAKLIPAEAMKK